ncbi:winged helix DNA-binding domain-containing protein [Nocardioides marmorisolisilvae]|uniref:winged helix DNA-binding domain-containing protein n=1 Tax=Nocardioides marmorisolisilvae TaxID=1542737 RepID=UPI0011CE971B|nr:winged helix DNA-binding domain-containing protein [Nocardioides marmorisolisilvae]
MTTLSLRTLTRTLWLRQQLVPGQRAVQGVPAVVEHVMGLQAQDNLPPYLSLAARVDGFSPADLSDLIEDRTLVRLFSMRGTVHVLTAADALTLRGWVQPALDRVSGTNQTSRPANHLTTEQLDAVVGPFLADGPQPHPEIGKALAAAYPDVAEEALRHVSRERLPLLQVPPRGLWKRSGGVVYQYVDRYLGQPFVEADVQDLVVRYLSAYGPATAADMTKWSLVTRLGPVFTAMAKDGRLVTVQDDKGRTLYDVQDAPVADEALELPALLLGMYDNIFLSHADRDRIAPDDARKAWMGVNGGVGSVLFLDGILAGLWKVDDGRVVVEPFTKPTRAQQAGIEAEIARVEALLAS